jgi:hypothetical protein
MATPKPWDQEWKVVEESDDEVETVDGAYVIAKTYGATEARADRAVFIAAAPAMARALLEVCGALSTNTLCSEGAHEMCERVLRQAGVLP